MLRPTELQLHKHAAELFERENPDIHWLLPAGVKAKGRNYAGLIERQAYLARIRDEMMREGVTLELGGRSDV